MELNLLELFGEPPPFAIAVLAAALVVLGARAVRRLRRRDDGRVAITLDE